LIIQLNLIADGNRILTCIKDTGIGIMSEELDKIFNMFYKADTDMKGYGLGLYINIAIIEAHQGEI